MRASDPVIIPTANLLNGPEAMSLTEAAYRFGVAPRIVARWERNQVLNADGRPFPQRVDGWFFRARLLDWAGYPAIPRELVAVWSDLLAAQRRAELEVVPV